MAVATAVQRWDRFRSSIFICHSGTHRGRSFTDAHPFVRSHAGRDWIFAHNGELGRNLNVTLPLDEGLGFEPVGHTDSEHALCWLMGQVRAAGARSFADVGWQTLHAWLQRLNELGTLNVIWSDGLHVVAYHDQSGYNALHYLRRIPPPSSIKLESDLLELDVSNSVDENRTLTVVSTRPLSDEAWSQLKPGEMRVISRGQVIETGERTHAAAAFLGTDWRAQLGSVQVGRTPREGKTGRTFFGFDAGARLADSRAPRRATGTPMTSRTRRSIDTKRRSKPRRTPCAFNRSAISPKTCSNTSLRFPHRGRRIRTRMSSATTC